MPDFTPEQITSMVDGMERDRSTLHGVMDRDVDLYNQEPYEGDLDPEGRDRLAGFAHFTSNNPTTIMDLALHMGSTAHRQVRVKEPREVEEEAETNNMSELFALGALKQADDRRANLLHPDIQSSMYAQSFFRGRVCQRVLLVKEEVSEEDLTPQEQAQRQTFTQPGIELPPPSRTYVDIADWDPRNVYFEMGKHGIEWACEKSWKTRSQIIAEYDIDPDPQSPIAVDRDESFYAIYDYFDETINQVIVQGNTQAKTSTEHGMKRTPVAFSYAENRPFFQQSIVGSPTRNSAKQHTNEYGRGLFNATRKMFSEDNFMYSVAKELSHRAINPAQKVFSRDGSLTLDEGDPRVAGQSIPLNTANEEDLVDMPPTELTGTALQFMGITGAMIQRGSFPTSAFGELAHPLSGFAITQLRMNLLAPLTTHTKAVEQATKQMLDILRDAYSTGAFDVMTMNGNMQDPQKTFFSRPVPPDMVRSGGIYEVEIVPQVPHDDPARLALITGIKESGLPVDDRTLLEMLDFQDPQQLIRAWWEQSASRGSPLAVAYNSSKAAFEQGNEAIAGIWSEEFNIQRMIKFLEMLELLFMGGGGAFNQQNGNGNGSAPAPRASGPSPTAAPPELLGIQSTPNPAASSAGALSNAGQPRPGAQNIDQRLANIGLIRG